MQKSLTISKLDAAKRQLEAFVRLYFNDGDPVAMHTLTAAAFGIVRDLNERRGGGPTLQDRVFEHVKPEQHKDLREKLNEAQNFFKHADRDHDSTIQFNPDFTEFIALDACAKYVELTGERPPLFQVFNGWMMITHQDTFVFPPEQRRQLEEGRKAFFQQVRLPSFARCCQWS